MLYARPAESNAICVASGRRNSSAKVADSTHFRSTAALLRTKGKAREETKLMEAEAEMESAEMESAEMESAEM